MVSSAEPRMRTHAIQHCFSLRNQTKGSRSFLPPTVTFGHVWSPTDTYGHLRTPMDRDFSSRISAFSFTLHTKLHLRSRLVTFGHLLGFPLSLSPSPRQSKVIMKLHRFCLSFASSHAFRPFPSPAHPPSTGSPGFCISFLRLIQHEGRDANGPPPRPARNRALKGSRMSPDGILGRPCSGR